MAWTDSKVFQQFLEDCVLNSVAFDLDSDSFLVALYDNDITPDNDAADSNTVYDAGVWDNVNEVSEAGQWAAGGVALASPAVNVGTADVVFWDANDTASGSAADLADVYGCLVYDATVSNRGVCYNYFGGANSVVNGTFTVVWSANGIWRATL